MPRFVQLNGARAGSSYPAEENALLGRDANCELMLKDKSVSRRHARLVFSDGNWELLDMGSRNGLYLEERRVNRIVLKGGEELKLGKLRMRFHLDSGEDWAGSDPAEEATASAGQLTEQILSDTGPAEVSQPAPKLSMAELRAKRIAEFQDEPRGGLLGGDVLQRAAWVRWVMYLVVLLVAAAACYGAFYLTRALRG